jgi:hypothetical protein
MDTKDQQILKLLSDDARLPMKTIAAAVGLARSSVRERGHACAARPAVLRPCSSAVHEHAPSWR